MEYDIFDILEQYEEPVTNLFIFLIIGGMALGLGYCWVPIVYGMW